MRADGADVLVVGAGPTGLAMAVELARRGVRVRIVDASAEPNGETRALGVQPRTLELFEKLGVAEAAVAQGVAVTRFSIFSENRPILRMSLDGLDSPYPFLLMLPQHQVEDLLRARLADAGVRVERPVKLISVGQGPDTVEARLAHADGTVEEATVPWLVGCDGAHSTVRHRLGIPFGGAAFEENFAVADLRMDWSLPHDEFFSHLNRGRFVAYFPMPGGLHRVAIAYPAGRVPQGEVTFEELKRAVDACAPAGARVAEVRAAGRFRINQRKVARHSDGRVFLAGDAAHVHSVVGAQGMNTGLQDAFNLGWKLACVIAGRARPELLAGYAAERAPVAHRLVKGTKFVTRMTLLHTPPATAARRTIAPHVLARPRVQRTLARALTQLDVSYRDGSGAGDGERIMVGDRAPDVPVEDASGTTTRLFQALDPETHTLLVFGPRDDALRRMLAGYAGLVRPVEVGSGGDGASGTTAWAEARASVASSPAMPSSCRPLRAGWAHSPCSSRGSRAPAPSSAQRAAPANSPTSSTSARTPPSTTPGTTGPSGYGRPPADVVSTWCSSQSAGGPPRGVSAAWRRSAGW